MSRRRAVTAAAGVILFGTSGCLSVTEPPETLFWSGTVEADAAAPFWLGGNSEMVANPTESSVGIFLDADPEEEEVTVSWVVRNGACSGTGEPIGPASAFPTVTLTGSGRGVGLASIRRRIPAGTYAAEVFLGADATGDRIACAELREQSGI